MPARIVLFLYTEFTGDNFWEIWSAIKSGAYHDEKMKKYASKELELYRKIFIEGPIAPVTTSDFLAKMDTFHFGRRLQNLLEKKTTIYQIGTGYIGGEK